MPDNDTLTLPFIKIGNWFSGEVNIIDFDDAIEIDKYIDIHFSIIPMIFNSTKHYHHIRNIFI